MSQCVIFAVRKKMLSFAIILKRDYSVSAREYIHNLVLIRLPTNQQTSRILPAPKSTASLILTLGSNGGR
jgi:hypothetical protein